jgi:hypothetical protein
MTLRDGVHASELGIVRIIREIARREFAKVLARTCETGHFFRFVFAVDFLGIEEWRIL